MVPPGHGNHGKGLEIPRGKPRGLLVVDIKRIDRMLSGGFDGGVKTEDGADSYGDVEGGEKDEWINIWGKGSDNRKEEGEKVAENEAEKGTEEAENQTFEEELEEDV